MARKKGEKPPAVQAGVRVEREVLDRLDLVAKKQKRKRADATRLLIEASLVAFDILGGDLRDLAVRLEKALKSRTASDRAVRGESHE